MKAVLLRLYVVLFVLFLLAPIVAITAGSLTTTSYVVFPPKGLTLKWYQQILGQPQFIEALGLSLAVGVGAATIGTMLAMPVALALHRYDNPFNRVLHLLVMTPVMLPSVFLGLAFLVAYSTMGIGGSTWALLAGHTMIATPFTVSLILVGLTTVDPSLERAARSLGATAFGAFRRVTLPLVAWSLCAGWGFAFLISFGSLEVSLFLSTTTMLTLPVQVYSALEWSPLDPLLTAISSGLVIITLVVLVVTARVVRMDRFLKGRAAN